jgi:hypothetical protein
MGIFEDIIIFFAQLFGALRGGTQEELTDLTSFDAEARYAEEEPHKQSTGEFICRPRCNSLGRLLCVGESCLRTVPVQRWLSRISHTAESALGVHSL